MIALSVLLLSMKLAFWSFYCEIGAHPHCCQKYGHFPKHRHRPFIQRFPQVCFCVSCNQRFRILTVKCLLY